MSPLKLQKNVNVLPNDKNTLNKFLNFLKNIKKFKIKTGLIFFFVCFFFFISFFFSKKKTLIFFFFLFNFFSNL
jgi:hypothetical protein